MSELTKKQVDKALSDSIKDGVAADSGAAMRGRDFITAFALALGAGNEIIGIIDAVPRLFHAIRRMWI